MPMPAMNPVCTTLSTRRPTKEEDFLSGHPTASTPTAATAVAPQAHGTHLPRKARTGLTSWMNSLAISCEKNGIASCNSSSSPAMASPTKSGLDASACPIFTKFGPSRVTARRMCRGALPVGRSPSPLALPLPLLPLLPLLPPAKMPFVSWSEAKASTAPLASRTICSWGSQDKEKLWIYRSTVDYTYVALSLPSAVLLSSVVRVFCCTELLLWYCSLTDLVVFAAAVL